MTLPKEPHRENCVVEYYFDSPVGTTIKNYGSAGSPYNGVASNNDYAIDPVTGYPSWVFDETTDFVRVPAGTVIDNLVAHTIELGFFYNAYTLSDKFFEKGPYQLYSAASYIILQRNGIGGTGYRYWATPVNSLVPGARYDVQMTWDSSITSDPIIKINNVKQSLTPTGNVDSWNSDAGYPMYLGNSAALNRYMNGTWYYARVHNAILPDPYLIDNFNLDHWRFQDPDTNILQNITPYGITPIYRPVSSPSKVDTFYNDGRTSYIVYNGGASSDTLVVTGVGICECGSVHDQSITIAAGTPGLIGPFPVEKYSDKITITHSYITSVTAAALRLPPISGVTNKPEYMKSCVLETNYNWLTAGKSNDLSGHGNRGTLLGGPSATTLPSGLKVYDLNGTDDHIDFADAASLEPSTAITVLAWVNLDTLSTSAYHAPVWFYNSTDGLLTCSYGIGSNYTTPEICVFLNAGASSLKWVTEFSFVLGTWQLIGFTYDGTIKKAYLNGVKGTIESTLTSGAINYAATGVDILTLGYHLAKTDGKVGQVWIFNAPLIQEQINEIYQATRGWYGA